MVLEKLKQSLLVTLGLIIVLGFFGFNYIYYMSKPITDSSQSDITVTIPKGSSTSEIASILKDNNLIKNETFFKIFAELNGYDSQFQAGKYRLSENMSLKQMMEQLVEGNAIIETVKFTIPEGFNVVQIADRLSSLGLVDKDKFLQLAKDGNFNYDFLQAIPHDNSVKYRLEGFLFPDTYEVKKGATEEEIINKMLSQFQKEWKPEWTKEIKKNNLTIPQAVTLASIVEREVAVDKERPIVAGVFFNRLKAHWPLQSCATVQFVLGKQKDILTDKDLEIQDPYNTYQNQGLPPGPIGSPGRKSLEAVVYPDHNDYFFFVTKKDNSREHYFSKTYQEHLYQDYKSRITAKGNY